LDIHSDLVVIGKILVIALAVGLDVLAVSIGIGVARLPPGANIRLGLMFSTAEIGMQALGYALGSHTSGFFGGAAAYAGFILLGLIGSVMLGKSFRESDDTAFDPSSGTGGVVTALSISLDSLGVGMGVAAAAIPFIPLLITISISTVLFTLTGLAFGEVLGARMERRAESVAGLILIILAIGFAVQRLV
jgi:putative Mn2+ efflux pump MntP